MYTIKTSTEDTIEIQKSKFICQLVPVHSQYDVLNRINEIKDKYKGANHYCYAYIIDQVKRFSDDGEPCGTAGMPILNVIESNNLNHVLAIVVRYFGGIKLGAGGLVRAYTQSVTNTLKSVAVIELKKGKKIEIIFPYNQDKQINYLLSNYQIIEKYFDENIKYIFNIDNKDLQIIIDHNIKYNILEDDIYI